MTAAPATHHPAPVIVMDRRPQRDDVTDAAQRLREIRRLARHCNDLSHQARHLFEDVCELSERDGHCCAGDGHFADAFGTSKRTIRRWIAELRDAGFLRVEGATNNRSLHPTEPAEKAEGLGQQGGLSDEHEGQGLGHDLGNGGVLSDGDLGHDLGHSGGGDLGHPGTYTKSIYIPPEGGEARARVRGLVGEQTPGLRNVTEGMPFSVALYTALVGKAPNVGFWPELQQVPDDERHARALLHTLLAWLGTHDPGHVGRPYNLTNVRGILSAYRRTLADEQDAEHAMPGDHLQTFDPNA